MIVVSTDWLTLNKRQVFFYDYRFRFVLLLQAVAFAESALSRNLLGFNGQFIQRRFVFGRYSIERNDILFALISLTLLLRRLAGEFQAARSVQQLLIANS